MDLIEGITPQDLNLFLAETDEQLQLLDEDIVQLERELNNNNLLQEIFRAAHTIKGSSAMIGHQRMSKIAHGMENVFDQLRKGTLTVNPQIVDVLLESLDILRALKEELVNGEESHSDVNSMLEILEAVQANPGAERQDVMQREGNEEPVPDKKAQAEVIKTPLNGENSFRIKVTFNKESTWASVRCFQVIQELSKTSTIINSNPSKSEIEAGKAGPAIELTVLSTQDEKAIDGVLRSVPETESVSISCNSINNTTPAKVETPSKEESTPKKEDNNVKQTIRVDVSRLDILMEQIGELVINRNRLGQIGKTLVERYQDDDLIRNLIDSLSQTGKIVNVLQQDIMSIRMLPIELVFNVMPRMVRDLARNLGKQVDFIVEGQETEVDRGIIEHLRDPLIHLLRNSVDHGIETPEQRRTAGKPATGTIKLSAYHEQDHIVIIVTDDGKGIDPEAVKESSISKGIISAEAVSRLTNNEIINLVMMSGVSTARKVTEVSGRGVGLDIVKKSIEFLNGTITIDSIPGKGARFTLKLPLTLAIIPALLVSLEQTTYAIPLSIVVEAIKLENKDIRTMMQNEATLFRGKVLPLLRLSTVFGFNKETSKDRILNHIVVVKAGELQIGLIVDSLIGQQEIVVKSLDQFVSGINGISGASILGDGQVVLILDINSLIKNSLNESQNSKEEKVLTSISG